MTRPYASTIVQCQTCPVQFAVCPSDLAAGRGKFCSKTCYNNRKPEPLKARLEREISIDGECRIWTGAKDQDGYGTITNDKRTYKTHRLAFELANGPIPETLCVCHTCDRPSCCNPKHLFLGTHGDNANDRVNKGRSKGAKKGEQHHHARLTDSTVMAIRGMGIDGLPHRDIAKKYGINQSTVSRIICGKRWSHV